MESGEKSYRGVDAIIVVIAMMMLLYHVVTIRFYLLTPVGHQNMHLLFSLILVFLVAARQHRNSWQWSLMLLLALLSLGSTVYVFIKETQLMEEMGTLFPPVEVIVVGSLLIFLSLEASRRAYGWSLPIVVLCFIAYPVIGQYLKGILRCPPFPLTGIIGKISITGLGVSGIYGDVVDMSASIIFIFMIFGSAMRVSGATLFFVEIGKLLGKRLAGGCGLTAVVGSALFGTISGSAVANSATIGSFTIPLMKKAGYAPYQAAAIEATASTGGQIMPPVMGIAAFVMAAMTGIPYQKICLMAAIPAVLYFLSVGLYVQFQAAKAKLAGMMEEPDYRMIYIAGPLFAIPLLVFIFFVVIDYPLNLSVLLCIFVLVVLSLIRKETRTSWREWINGLTEGAIMGAQVGVTCAAIQVMCGAMSLTSLGLKIPALVEYLCGGHLTLALIFGALASLLLGTAVATVPTYVLVAVTVVPVLVGMGVSVGPAHLFNFYFACISILTPPTAIVVLVTSKMAKAPFFKSGIEATKVAIAGFLVPFLIIWAPIITLRPDDALWSILMILNSIALITAVQVLICGYYLTDVRLWERLLFFAISLLLFFSMPIRRYEMASAGLILFVLATLWQFRMRRQILPNRNIRKG